MILRILLFCFLCTLGVKAYSPLSIYEANGDLLIKDPIGLTFNGTSLSQSGGNVTIVPSATGTVTSIDISGDNGLSASGGPVTSSGTITVTLDQGQVLVPSSIGTAVQAYSTNLDTLSGNDGSNLTGVDATTLDTIDSTGFLQNGAVTINNGNSLVQISNATLQDTDIVVITPETNLSNYTNDSGFLENGNNLSDLDNTSTARTNLGVAIGSDVQAYSANLDVLTLNNGVNLINVDALTLNGEDLSNFALLNADNTFTGNNTFSSSDTTDAVQINQTSSTGIALDITKSGNNEGLRVTKSSGTGNAVTIAGGTLGTNNNINMSGETASRVAYFDASKNIKSSTVTSTELGYLSGVTSAIQTQINNKIEDLTSFDTDDLAEGATNLYYTGARFNADLLAEFTGANGSLLTSVNGAVSELTVGTDQYVLKVNGDKLAWEPEASGGGGSSSGVAGSVQFSDGASGFDSNATNLFWDDSNQRLGIQTNAPDYDLHLKDGVLAVEGTGSVGGIPTRRALYLFQEGASSANIQSRADHISWKALKIDGGQIAFNSISGGRTDFNGVNIDTNSRVSISTSATKKGLVVKASSGQSANLTEWQDSSATVLTSVEANGDISTSGLSVDSDISVSESIVFDAEVDDGNSGTADTIDWGTGNKHKSTLTGNVTYTFTAPPGTTNVLLRLVQDGTGSRTATWPGTVKWPGGTAPTLSTAAGAEDIVSCYYNGTNYYCQAGLNFQ